MEVRRLKKTRALLLLVSCCASLVFCAACSDRQRRTVRTFGQAEEPAMQTILDIYGMEDFLAFADSVSQGNTYEGRYVNLYADLDFSRAEEPVVVGNRENTICRFCGIFDGNAHRIKNLVIEEEEAGLFLNLDGTVYNLYIESGKLSGGLCGAISPKMSEWAMIMNCASYAEVEGDTFDGLVGMDRGTVKNCVSSYIKKSSNELNQGLYCLGGMYQVDGWHLWMQTEEGPKLTAREANTLASMVSKLEAGDRMLPLKGYFSEEQGTWCIALPAGYEDASLDILLTFADGSVGKLSRERGEAMVEYEKDAILYTVRFPAALNAASMFLDTDARDSKEFLHGDKKNELYGNCVVLGMDGTFQDYPSTQIRGHGNDSFRAPKRSYNLTFMEPVDLDRMGASRKYVLLSGYRDNSLMAYKLTNDLAQEIGMSYSQQTRMIHLYLDGEYLGMYLLTGRIEIGPDRFALKDMEAQTKKENPKALGTYERQDWKDESTSAERIWFDLAQYPADVTGGWILEMDKRDYDPEKSRFVSAHGVSMVLRSMPYASKEQVDYIADWWQGFEDALYAEDGYNGEGRYYTEYIDVESFADQWLFYELNMENSLTSSVFFYKDSQEMGDDVLHAAYPWDLEHSLTRASSARQSWFATTDKGRNGYWTQLYRHEDFARLVDEEWERKFLPALKKALSSCEGEDSEGIRPLSWYRSYYGQDAELNQTRWEESVFEDKMDKIDDIYAERSVFLTRTLTLWEKNYLGFYEEEGQLYGITKGGEKVPVNWDGECCFGR